MAMMNQSCTDALGECVDRLNDTKAALARAMTAAREDHDVSFDDLAQMQQFIRDTETKIREIEHFITRHTPVVPPVAPTGK